MGCECRTSQSGNLDGSAARKTSGVDDDLCKLKADIDRTLAQIGCPSMEQLS
jgi:(S)-mandelate dehydrogenase